MPGHWAMPPVWRAILAVMPKGQFAGYEGGSVIPAILSIGAPKSVFLSRFLPGHLLAMAMALMATLLVGCERSEIKPRSLAEADLKKPKNVVVVVVDTLRADRMSLYGYSRETTPVLNSFTSRNSLIFENNRSQAACTFPSVNSLLSSKWPAEFLGQNTGDFGIHAGVPTLQSLLSEKGFWTAAFSASRIVRLNPSKFNKLGGYGEDWDLFLDDCMDEPGSCLTDALKSHEDQLTAGRPFLLYLHYMDPHAPYRPSKANRIEFSRSTTKKQWVRWGNPQPIARRIRGDESGPDYTQEDLEYLKDLYDADVKTWDGFYGDVVTLLADLDLLEETLFVLTSDHGESHLEHGDILHCRSLYDTEIRVPLVFSFDGFNLEESRRTRQSVANVDVVPTILDLLSIEIPDSMVGRSLWNDDLDVSPESRPIFSSQSVYRSVIQDGYKLIYNLERGELTLYSLVEDPLEEKDLSASESTRVRTMWQELKRWIAKEEGDKGLRDSKEVEAQLKAVGYLQ